MYLGDTWGGLGTLGVGLGIPEVNWEHFGLNGSN